MKVNAPCQWDIHVDSSVNALAPHRCDPGSIPGVGMWDGHVVTKSNRWVSSGYSIFLPHEDHPNANIGANEHDKYKLYNLFRNRCKINKF